MSQVVPLPLVAAAVIQSYSCEISDNNEGPAMTELRERWQYSHANPNSGT
jgi:hypothetical protein